MPNFVRLFWELILVEHVLNSCDYEHTINWHGGAKTRISSVWVSPEWLFLHLHPPCVCVCVFWIQCNFNFNVVLSPPNDNRFNNFNLLWQVFRWNQSEPIHLDVMIHNNRRSFDVLLDKCHNLTYRAACLLCEVALNIGMFGTMTTSSSDPFESSSLNINVFFWLKLIVPLSLCTMSTFSHVSLLKNKMEQ